MFTASEIAEAFSFTYAINGYAFVGFTFESIVTTPRTFIYNVTASQLLGKDTWQEQQTGISDGEWRISSIDFVYNRLIVTDLVDGRYGYLSDSTYTEYGDLILREKVTGPVDGQGDGLYYADIELTPDSGQGLITGQGSDPQVMMDWSDTGARTWSNQLWRSPGKIGDYPRRMEWRRLGRSPAHRVWRFRQTDPIKTVWIKMEAVINAAA